MQHTAVLHLMMSFAAAMVWLCIVGGGRCVPPCIRGITLNGGPAGWRAVLPNEKHEFSAGWRAAQKGGPAGCTTGWASGLHIKAIWQAAH